MKKSFPVNINGNIYYFDEDAYQQLSKYYDNLRRTFTGDDGEEIVADIEDRVAEILSESHSSGTPVVTIRQINEIIQRMGQPDQLDSDTANDCSDAERTTPGTPPPFDTNTYSAQPASVAAHNTRRLYRNVNDKVIGGVISGLACYFGCSVTALRVALVLLAACTQVWPLTCLYVIAWIIIPAAETPRQQLEMTGQQITVDNVGKTTILGTPEPGQSTFPHGASGEIGRVLGVVIMSLLGIVGFVIGISMLVLLISSVAGIIAYLCFDIQLINPGNGRPLFTALTLLLTSLAWLIPAVAAVWASCCTLFKAKGVTRNTVIIIAIIEFILIAVSVAMCASIDAYNFVVCGWNL